MRILFTVHRYYPYTGGVELVTKYLAEGLSKLGNEVSVVTTKCKETKKYEKINNVNIYRFNIKKNKLLGYVGEKKEYVDFVKNFDCDVIINECTECATTYLLLEHLKEIKAKKILHAHGAHGLSIKFFMNFGTTKNTLGNMFNYIKSKIYFQKFYKYLNEYNKVIGLSKVDVLLNYAKKYIDTKKIEILENATDDIFFEKPDQNKRQIDKYIKLNNKNYVINVANYSAIKNQKLIMKAFYESNISTYSLVFIGKEKTDYYYKLLKYDTKLKKKYGKKEVYLLINVKREDIPNILLNARFYIVGSISEQYSISIIEAMSQGIPFISTNTGNASILPGGIVVNNCAEMVTEMEKLANNPKRIKELGLLGKEYARSYCREEYAIKKLNNIINNLIELGE